MTAPVVSDRPKRTGTRIVSVASGKGGTGKTVAAVNIAWALAERGRRVCLLDADLGLSNVDVLLGIRPQFSLEDVLFEGVPLEQAVTAVGRGVDVISGGSGVARLAELDRTRRRSLVEEFSALDGYDYLLIDNSPGISSQVISFCLAAREIIVVVNPEASSVTDAYALIKVLKENGLWFGPRLLINRTPDEARARFLFKKFNEASIKFLKLKLDLLGSVLEDEAVKDSVLRQRPLMEVMPDTKAGRGFSAVAEALELGQSGRKTVYLYAGEYWEQSVTRFLQRPAAKNAHVISSGAMELLLTSLEMLAGKVGTLAATPEASKRKAMADTILKDLAGVRDLLTDGKKPLPKSVKQPQKLQAAEKKKPAIQSAQQPQKSAEKDEAPHEQNESAFGDAVVVGTDAALNDLVVEVLKSAGFHPLVLPAREVINANGSASKKYSLSVVGLDSASSVEAFHALAGTPRIVLKGWSETSRKVEGLAGPGVRVLTMPFSVEAFVTAVAELAVGAAKS